MSPPSSTALQQLHHLDKSSPDFHDQVCNVFYGEKYRQCVPKLRADDSVWLVDYLDGALDGLDPSSAAFRKCLRELRSICGARGILPASYTLSSDLLSVAPEPFASGGYGDVHKGTLGGSRVCIKRVRVYAKDGPRKTTRMFCQEAVMWKRLTHPNILPLLGITITPFQLVSNWMSGGDLPEYIEKHSDADRLELVSDVAKGLSYLHSCNVVHGDLKGLNILMDDSDHARIADFGLATVTQNLDSMQSASCQRGHTARWSAPEVLSEGACSKEADVFSFAMVMIEAFTGAVPFSNGSSIMAMLAVIQGKRPPRPTHPTFTDGLWTLIQRCWDQDPLLRPEVSEVLQVLLTPEYPPWKRLISQPLTVDERVSLITTILSDDNQVEMVRQLFGDDAQAFIDVMDEALDELYPFPQTRRRCYKLLYRMCGRCALLPKALKIPASYDRTTSPLYRGGFADVWKEKHRGLDVAVKSLRIYSYRHFRKIVGRFCKEVVKWKFLQHPNVLPLIGVTVTETQLAVVSEWMVNGSVNDFVKAHPDVDRLTLLGGIAKGLVYLHSQGVIHGDLKGANVLVDRSGHARLVDFGLLMIMSDLVDIPSPNLSSLWQGGTSRWMSPELINPQRFGLENSRPTKASDCYALGMVIYETISGYFPFHRDMTLAVFLKVLEGERPPREACFTDSLWRMLELCWKPQPGDRPSIEDVLRCLEMEPPLQLNVEMEEDEDYWD